MRKYSFLQKFKYDHVLIHKKYIRPDNQSIIYLFKILFYLYDL